MLGVVVVAAGGDLKDRVTLGEHAPKRALASAESPAGLVHVDRARRADTRKDVVAGLGQRVGGPREDRVDHAGADARSKQLLAELDEVAAADAVADRQHRDRGLITAAQTTSSSSRPSRGSPRSTDFGPKCRTTAPRKAPLPCHPRLGFAQRWRNLRTAAGPENARGRRKRRPLWISWGGAVAPAGSDLDADPADLTRRAPRLHEDAIAAGRVAALAADGDGGAACLRLRARLHDELAVAADANRPLGSVALLADQDVGLQLAVTALDVELDRRASGAAGGSALRAATLVVRLPAGSLVVVGLDAGALVIAGLDAGALVIARLDAGALVIARLDAGALVIARLDAGALVIARLDAGALVIARLDAGALVIARLGAGALVIARLGAGALVIARLGAGALVIARLNAGALVIARLGAGALVIARLGAGALVIARLGAGALVIARLGAGALVIARLGGGALVIARLGAGALVIARLGAGALVIARLGAGALVIARLGAG